VVSKCVILHVPTNRGEQDARSVRLKAIVKSLAAFDFYFAELTASKMFVFMMLNF